MTPKVGQPVQYFNTKGEGPFAATVIRTADTYDFTKAEYAAREYDEAEVSLSIDDGHGSRTIRHYVPLQGSGAYDHQTQWEKARAPKETDAEGNEVEPTVVSRSWTPLEF